MFAAAGVNPYRPFESGLIATLLYRTVTVAPDPETVTS